MSQQDFDKLTSSIQNLQIVQRLGSNALNYLKNSQDIELLDMLYVPDQVDLGKELTTIFGLVYSAAGYVNEQLPLVDSYEDIDLAPLLADPAFRAYLLATPENKHSSLLISNIANLLLNVDDVDMLEDVSGFIKLTDDLLAANPESALWHAEVSALIGAVLDFAASLKDSPYLTLSLNGIEAVTDDLSQLSLGIISQYADLAVAQAHLVHLTIHSSLERALLQQLMNLVKLQMKRFLVSS
jgi:hypothetical protein